MNTLSQRLNYHSRRWPILLVLMLVVLLLPAAAQAAKDFTVTGGTSGTDYTYTEDGVLTFLKGGEYSISMAEGGTSPTDNQIIISTTEIFTDTQAITLTLNNLKMERAGGNSIYFNYTGGPNDIDTKIEFIVVGENIITNTNGYSIRSLTNNSSLKISNMEDNDSPASLTFNTSVMNDQLGLNSFILDAKNVTVNLNNTALNTYYNTYIFNGDLNIVSSEQTLYASGEFYMTGGNVHATNISNKSSLTVTNIHSAQLGVGLQVSGGKLTLDTADPASSGSSVIVLGDINKGTN